MRKPRESTRWIAGTVLLSVLLIAGFFTLTPVSVKSQEDRSVSGILSPRIGLPKFLLPDDGFDISVVGEDTGDWMVRVVNEVNQYDLEILSTQYNSDEEATTLQVELPDVQPGLYDLWIKPTPDSPPMVEPHSVAVRRSLQPPFDVLHVTDTHYDTSEGQLHLKQTFQRTIRLINFLRPDFVLHTGDACNNPREEFFSGFRHELLALEVPIVVIPGNHDHTGEKNFFETYISPWDGSIDVGPLHIVYLDTGEYALSGGLRPDQVDWMEQDLEEHSDAPLKIFMSHHPVFSSPPGYPRPYSGLQNFTDAGVDRVLSIFQEHDVGLILHGHMHESIIRHEPILTIITSNAYPGGRPYAGFRRLTIESDLDVLWRYAGDEDAIPLFDLDVEYLQQYHPHRFIEGYPSGAAVLLTNSLETAIDGKLTFRLLSDEGLNTSGGSVSSISDAGDHVIVVVETSLSPGEEKTVTVSTVDDNQPPEVFDPDIEVVESRRVRLVKMNWTVIDLGSGVQDAYLTYSIDNETWSEEELLRLSVDHFGGTVQIPIEEATLFYVLSAEDFLGQETTFGPRTMTFETEEPTEPGEPALPLDNYLLLGAVVAVVAVLAGLLYWRTRRAG